MKNGAEVYFHYIQRTAQQVNNIFTYIKVLGAILGKNLIIIFNYKAGLVGHIPIFLNIKVIFATKNAYI